MLLTYFEDAALTLAALPAPLHFCIAVIYGTVIGSFLTVVVHRLPIMLEREWQEEIRPEDGVPLSRYDLCLPRSACTDCGNVLKSWHNVPVLSYLALRGRCGFCGVRISARYLLLELATGALSIGVVWRFGWTWHALAGFALASTLLALAVIDAQVNLLPDAITLPLLWAGLSVNLAGTFSPLHSAVIGAIAGYGTLWLTLLPSRVIFGRHGVGFGDFKLYGALGAWLGWSALPNIFLISIVAAAIWGGVSILLGKRARSDAVPLGPFIAFAGATTLFCSTRLFDWIFS